MACPCKNRRHDNAHTSAQVATQTPVPQPLPGETQTPGHLQPQTPEAQPTQR